MSTKISDIIKPYILGKMVPAILTEHMDFLSTGLATKDYDNVTLTSGGNTVEFPTMENLLVMTKFSPTQPTLLLRK